MQYNHKFLLAVPLFSVILIDSIGLSVIIPMLYPLVMDPDVSILSHAVGSSSRYFYYNIAMCAFMIAWFFGSVFLGDLSDKIGRRNSLLYSLIGFTFGFILSAVAVVAQSFWLLVIGRLINGFTAGNQTIALAGAVDISGANERARFLGYIQFASSLGTISGPVIGGFLSDSHIVSWFTYATPFYFSALLAMLNLLLVYFGYYEMNLPKRPTRENKGYGQLFMAALQNPKIRQLSIIALLIMLGWSAYYTTISLYLQDRLQYTTKDIAEYLAISAIGFMFGTLYLINVFKKMMQLSQIIIFGLLLAASGLTITLLTANTYLLYSLSITICCGFSLAVTALLAQFSNTVSDSKQGWVMGISQAITAFAFGVTGLLQAFVSYYSITATMIGAVILLISAAGVTFRKIAKKSIERKLDTDGGWKKYD